MRSALVVLLSLVLGSAVGCDPTGYPPFDRSALLRETTDTLILPAYAAAATDGATLRTATESFCASPSAAGLASAQDAWLDAVGSWRRAAPFLLTSSPALPIDSNLTFEASPTTIDAHVASTEDLSAPTYVAALGAQDKGFFALEYLLFGYPGFTTRDDAQTLTALGDARRCQYAALLAADIATQTSAASGAWTSGFATTFTTANGGPYSSPQAAVNELVTAIANAIDTTRDHRIGRPLGRTAHAGPVESRYAGVSVALMELSLESAHDAWTMTPHSLDAFLRSRNGTLAGAVLADFDGARTAVEALRTPPLAAPWESYVGGTDHAAGNTAYDAVNTLELSLASDVASTLGLNVLLRSDGD